MQSTKEIELKPVNVFTIVEEIITLYTQMSSQKSVTLFSEVRADVWIDANPS